jgi:hypothetical protein
MQAPFGKLQALPKAAKPVQDRPYPFKDSQVAHLVLTPQDHYKIEIEMTPGRMYLYVFEMDMVYGSVQRLFPPDDADASALIQNSAHVEIPAGANKWRRLKKHSQKKAATIAIHIFAGPWRAKDIESVYQEFLQRLNDHTLSVDERKELVERLLSRIDIRMDARWPCFYYSSISFQQDS